MKPEEIDVALLRAADGQAIPLEGVRASAAVNELLARVQVEQRYRNRSETNVEAVYTFPLPLDAVLLGLELDIGERNLKAIACPKRAAGERYEEAIAEGHTALMLEQPAPGLYTMNLGNLMAGECATVRFDYVLPNRWSSDTLRFSLPTVIAPRYGDPRDAGFAPHQAPETDLFAQYPFDVTVEFSGALAAASIECPSHPVAIEATATLTRVRLKRLAALDRDFVLVARCDRPFEGAAIFAPDGEGYVAFAALAPSLGAAAPATPLDAKVLVDCSGSMQGDSIAQARAALLTLLDRMRDDDRFSITAFGSSTRRLFDAQMRAEDRTRPLAGAFVRELQADMGGTEMRAALQSVFDIRSDGAGCDVLLVTDGEVHDFEGIVHAALASRHRLFAVGVGSAANDALLMELATATGGWYERVLPGESIDAAIERHAARMRTPRAQLSSLDWPQTPAWSAPQHAQAVYAGEMLHLFAGFASRPEGQLALVARAHDGSTIRAVAQLREAENDALAALLPRLAAAWRIRTANEARGTELALRHGLLSRYTHLVAVLERSGEQRADGLPALRAVPQMMAAGWGGIGSVDMLCLGELVSEFPMGASFELSIGAPGEGGATRRPLAELLSMLDPDPLAVPPSILINAFIDVADAEKRARIEALVDRYGLQAAGLALLRSALDEGHTDRLARDVQRSIRKACKDAALPHALLREAWEIVRSLG